MSTLRAMIQELDDRLESDEAGELVIEDDDELDEGLSELADVVEEAGFEVPEDIDDVESFLAAVERDVIEAEELDEKLGQKIKAAWHKAKKAVHGYMQKRKLNKAWKNSPFRAPPAKKKKKAKAGALRPQHASADSPEANLSERGKGKWREMPYKGPRTAMGMPKKRKRKLA